MTKTALENKRMENTRRIEKDKLLHDTNEKSLDRELAVSEGNANRANAINAARINAVSRVGSSLLSRWGKKNDPAWYKSFLSNLDTFTNLPTYDRLGVGLLPEYLNTDMAGYHYQVPGIIVMSWAPTCGPQSTSNTAHFRNAVNQSLARTKERVLALNSRSSVSWEAADLGYNVFASADIMTQILELGRVICVYKTYYPRNAYFAKSIITALGYDYDDIASHYAEYRKAYSILASKFNSAVIAPATITMYKRRAFLAMQLFCDDSINSEPRQVYAYKQAYGFTLGDDATSCRFDSINNTVGIDTIAARIQLQMTNLVDNPDIIEMYQDLRHAFGNNLVQLVTDPNELHLIINSDELNREQIHNLKSIPVGMSFSNISLPSASWSLRQDESGYLYQGNTDGRDRKVNYSLVDTSSVDLIRTQLNRYIDEDTGKALLNMHSDNVTGDQILDITRLTWTGKFSWDSTSLTLSLTIGSVGTELITDMKVYALQSDGNLTYAIFSSFDVDLRTVASDAMYDLIRIPAMLSCFKWAPMTTWFYCKDAYENVSHATFLDAHTSFLADNASLSAINDAAVLGELTCEIPGYGNKSISNTRK